MTRKQALVALRRDIERRVRIQQKTRDTARNKQDRARAEGQLSALRSDRIKLMHIIAYGDFGYGWWPNNKGRRP